MKSGKKLWPVAVLLFVLFVFSALLCVYYKSGVGDYSSVLDRYLNSAQISLLMFSAVFMLFSAVFWGVFFVVTLVRMKKSPKITKAPVIVCAVFAVLFLLANGGTWAGILAGQAQEATVIDSVTPLAAHVDFVSLFGAPGSSTYHEQTNQYKINNTVPVHYEVQQSDSAHSVYTACTEVTDGQVLSDYYKELQQLYADYSEQPLDAQTAAALGAVQGFYYTIDRQTLGVVVQKGDKIFNLSIDGMTDLNDTLLQQIAALQ